jgi:TATA-binding protein-associated factor Taf7
VLPPAVRKKEAGPCSSPPHEDDDEDDDDEDDDDEDDDDEDDDEDSALVLARFAAKLNTLSSSARFSCCLSVSSASNPWKGSHGSDDMADI